MCFTHQASCQRRLLRASSKFLSSSGHPEGEHGSGEDPRRERHQTEESVCELPEDERPSRRRGSESPDGSYNEPGAPHAASVNVSTSMWQNNGSFFFGFISQVTKSMAGVVKGMDATLKSMNLEKVSPTKWYIFMHFNESNIF